MSLRSGAIHQAGWRRSPHCLANSAPRPLSIDPDLCGDCVCHRLPASEPNESQRRRRRRRRWAYWALPLESAHANLKTQRPISRVARSYARNSNSNSNSNATMIISPNMRALPSEWQPPWCWSDSMATSRANGFHRHLLVSIQVVTFMGIRFRGAAHWRETVARPAAQRSCPCEAH